MGCAARQSGLFVSLPESGLLLRCVSSVRRMILTHIGVQWLDDWLEENSAIFRCQHPEPWGVERQHLRTLSWPLNIQDGAHHPFYLRLSVMRAAALSSARNAAVTDEGNQRRGRSADALEFWEFSGSPCGRPDRAFSFWVSSFVTHAIRRT